MHPWEGRVLHKAACFSDVKSPIDEAATKHAERESLLFSLLTREVEGLATAQDAYVGQDAAISKVFLLDAHRAQYRIAGVDYFAADDEQGAAFAQRLATAVRCCLEASEDEHHGRVALARMTTTLLSQAGLALVDTACGENAQLALSGGDRRTEYELNRVGDSTWGVRASFRAVGFGEYFQASGFSDVPQPCSSASSLERGCVIYFSHDELSKTNGVIIEVRELTDRMTVFDPTGKPVDSLHYTHSSTPLGRTCLPKSAGAAQQSASTGAMGDLAEERQRERTALLQPSPSGTCYMGCRVAVQTHVQHSRPMGPVVSIAVPPVACYSFSVGDRVDYYSAAAGIWFGTCVVGVNAWGTYNLECKADVPPEKLRLAPLLSGTVQTVQSLDGGQLASVQNSMAGASAEYASALPSSASITPATGWKVGDSVEYFSSTASRWILAQVHGANSNGTYNLDCKPYVPSGRIRAVLLCSPSAVATVTASNLRTLAVAPPMPSTPSCSATYMPGDIVEYLSVTKGGWIPTRILAQNARGTYNLECKPDVTSERIRRWQGEAYRIV